VNDKLAPASDPPAFTDADFEYMITEKEAIIKKARLLGPKINLKGEGKITLDGELALEFHPEPGGEGPEHPSPEPVCGRDVRGDGYGVGDGTVWNPVLKGGPADPDQQADAGPLGRLSAGEEEGDDEEGVNEGSGSGTAGERIRRSWRCRAGGLGPAGAPGESCRVSDRSSARL